MQDNASKAWEMKLHPTGYEHHCATLDDLTRITKPGRILKKLISHINLQPQTTIFELGCGGGRYLATLALNDFSVHGIDVSPDVVSRCRNYLNEVEKLAGHKLQASVKHADIFNYKSPKLYDLTYQVGVVEHFLDLKDRMFIWNKLFEMTKPGGWIVSAVPNGSHLWRTKMREERLCGYDIPEIDYCVTSHEQEFKSAGLKDVIAFPWNYFGFAEGMSNTLLTKLFAKIIFYSSNLVLPVVPCPRNFKEKFAHTLLVFGRKPL